MKNKLKKYIKVFVYVMLMMFLLIPSYAALTDLNDDAFITKAEFDSAISDFNQHMTTFESSINSKLDLEITSYLQKNGIWVSTPQTLVFSKKTYDIGTAGETDNILLAISRNGSYLVPQTRDVHYADELLIDNISKTGLFVCSFDSTIETTFNYFGFSGKFTSGGGVTTRGGDERSFTYGLSFRGKHKGDSDDKKYTMWNYMVYEWTGYASNDTVTTSYHGLPTPAASFTFFVQKDDSVYFSPWYYWYAATEKNNKISTTASNDNYTTRFNLNIKEVVVY